MALLSGTIPLHIQTSLAGLETHCKADLQQRGGGGWRKMGALVRGLQWAVKQRGSDGPGMSGLDWWT